MKTRILLIALIYFLTTEVYAAKPEILRYEIECTGQEAAEGSYLVRVWIYRKEKKITSELLKKYAVHGVIFKGYAGKTGCKSQPAMANISLEKEREDYFKPFFGSNKTFALYATEVSGTMERMKVGKEYKFGMVVTVAKTRLRQDLESAGVIRGLSTGF